MYQKKEKIVFGIDETGRGPLSGPVIAVAVYDKTERSFNSVTNNIKIKDSKKMTEKQREEVYKFLKKNKQVEWGIGNVSNIVIDKINILEATKLAMKKAVFNLEKKIQKKANLLLIDGNFKINVSTKQKSIIKGDEKILLISLASIVAKVHRDRIMKNYHKKYPEYNFTQNKGYPTREHYRKLSENGACKIHRKTFKGVT